VFVIDILLAKKPQTSQQEETADARMPRVAYRHPCAKLCEKKAIGKRYSNSLLSVSLMFPQNKGGKADCAGRFLKTLMMLTV